MLVFAGVGFAASVATTPPADSMPGTESQKAFDLLQKKFPAVSAEGTSARVVIRAPRGQKLSGPEARNKVEIPVADLKKAPGVIGAADLYQAKSVSKDGTTAYRLSPRIPPSLISLRPPEAVFSAARAASSSYGLSQAGRAPAAVSPNLPAVEEGRRPWQLKGHGIETNPQGRLRDIPLMPPKNPNPHGATSFAGVAQALGCEGLPSSGARLGEPWAALPDTRHVPLEDSPHFPARQLEAQSP
ncbi:MMPL family transporter [Streptomyces sp. HUAS TT7]|uniref:MMPL family transporter n=1 Tax=Streptomyces sp. HUAS TT7 TaxID=3447507 RepID=UPI003F65EDAC